MQGPEQYLAPLGISLACAVHPEQEAILDAGHRIFVNYETYYVSTAEARDVFLAAPHAHAGRVTDPVSRHRFLPGPESPRADYNGRVFLFETEETAETFTRAPADYATPMLSMVPAAK